MNKTGWLTVCCLFVFTAFLNAQTKSAKRGFCGDLNNVTDLQLASNLAWYYNWGQSAKPAIAATVKDYIDYVPMIWGKAYNKTALRTYLTAHPEIKYLLAFNEPNFIEQANIGPKAAAALWPELQAIADDYQLKLVSPALNFSYPGGAVIEDGIEYTDPIKYLDDFFAALPTNSRVDYVAIHGYFDNAGALPWYIGLYNKYNKPVWLTEFNHSASVVNETTQQNYMVEALNYLENEPKVFRYAWFLARSTQANTNLFSTSSLTDLGLVFSNMSSYDTSFFHSPENIMEAEHYINMKGIHLIKVKDASGILAAHDFDAGDWMDYNVNVPEAGVYKAEFRITSVWASSLSVFSGSKLLGRLTTPITGGLETWQTITMNINLPKGKQKIRIVTNGGGWKLNWWKLNHSVTSVQNISKEDDALNLYPNPVTNKRINITGTTDDCTLTIAASDGRIVGNHSINGSGSVDLGNLSSGVYHVRIVSKSGITNKKIMVL